MKVYEEIIEKLIGHFTESAYASQVVDAKKEFFGRLGLPDEDDMAFDLRMSQFLDWLLFSRSLPGKNMPPVDYVLAAKDFVIPDEQRVYFENLAKNRHSLFEFVRHRGQDLLVKDLLNSETIQLKEAQVLLGYNREEIFEARLIPHEDNFFFTNGFCFHPSEARRYILKEIKKCRKAADKEKEEFMLRLLKMRLKYDQYKHIEIQHIYTNNSKLRF